MDSFKENWAMFLSVVLLVASGIITFLALSDSKSAPAKTNETAAVLPAEEADSPAAAASKSALVELGATGPNPDSLTITPGSSVVWKKTSM